MFKKLPNARLVWSPRSYAYVLMDGEKIIANTGASNLDALTRGQETYPRILLEEGHKTWWMFENGFFFSDEPLTIDEFKVKARHSVLRKDALHGRKRIPEKLRHEVWLRDEGKCVRCGSRENLEFDHIIPVSKGGSNTEDNIELLCESCNRKKGNKI